MPILTADLLERIASRAAGHDSANTFPFDDLDDLRQAGYLAAMVPEGFGGRGLTLTDLVAEQARLAAAAPATALAVGMHLIVTAVARTVLDRGDASLAFILREASAGELFAFAISEAGNDLVLFGSETDATPLPTGGYAFTGTKISTSLSPAWTRLITLGLDVRSEDAPKLVYGVIARDSPGIEVRDDWDALGMRATQSRTTVLRGAVVERGRIVRRLDPGPSADPLVFAIFANFELLVAAVYAGIADRALQLGVEAASGRVSKRTGLRGDQDAVTRWRLAEAALARDALWPVIRQLAGDVDAQVDHGAQWSRRLVGAKWLAVDTAKRVVDLSISVAGGKAFSASHELSRLYRDVLAGGFHPSNDDAVHATVATALLGPLDEEGRG